MTKEGPLQGNGRFAGADGTPLDYRFLRHPFPKGALILVHGFSEHSGRYEETISRLAAAGQTVYAFDLRGHGSSGGLKGHVDRFETLVEDLACFVRLVTEREGGLKKFIVGHSLGGQIAINYALQYGDRIDGLILSSPNLAVAFPVSTAKKLTARLIDRISPTFPLPHNLPSHYLSRDPQVVRRYDTDPLVLHRITVRFALEILANQQKLFGRADRLQIPLLLMQAEDDRVCSAEASKEFFDKITLSDKVWKGYPGFYHELFNEPGREQVFQEIERWIHAHP